VRFSLDEKGRKRNEIRPRPLSASLFPAFPEGPHDGGNGRNTEIISRASLQTFICLAKQASNKFEHAENHPFDETRKTRLENVAEDEPVAVPRVQLDKRRRKS